MTRRQAHAESFVERHAPAGFVIVGMAMLVVAAFDYLPAAVGVALVVLGAALVVLGGILPSLEAAVELGPGGLRAQLHERKAELLAATGEVAPERVEPLRALADYLDPTTALHWGVRSPDYRRKLDRELVRVWLSDAWGTTPVDEPDAPARDPSRLPRTRR
jgi:hypothetical protein